ncbi:MAG: ABC transporter permease [Kineosporiaceae bacterium]
MTTSELVRLGIGTAVLLACTLVVLRVAGVSLGSRPVVAVARGAAQLAAVGLLLRGVIAAPWAVALAVLVMLTTATVTAARRLKGFEQVGRRVVAACAGGAGLALGVVFALGVLPAQSRYVIALAGIVLGNTMTAATLAGRLLRSALISRREEVEGWLALGATMRQATDELRTAAAAESLVPVLDQTRTTGLVTLPGAFVGALLGGASPVQAARFQLVVLAALICAQAVVAVVLTWLLAAPRQVPVSAG